MLDMAKKIIAAVKKAVKKTVVKKEKKVVEIVPVSCGDCGGRGLLDQHTLCAHCAGNGTV
jgi:DnaJ-class molecular chaperone